MRPQKGRGKFQLTAARRRLGSMRARTMWPLFRFNSQPREGGWAADQAARAAELVSTHSRAKAAGCVGLANASNRFWFQLTAARRRLEYQIR